MRRFGELSNRQRRMEISLRICQCALDTVGFGLQLQQCRELRLAAGAAMINDQLPGYGPGDIRAQILFDHSQCEADARSHPSRGPHRAVDDENAVFLDLHFWKASLQYSRAEPLRRCAAAVQQTCCGEHDRAGASRGYSPGSLQTLAQKFDDAWR